MPFLSSQPPLHGRAAWSGGGLGPLTLVVVDLSAYAGQSAILRFRLTSDDGTAGGGWYIDDVLIKSATGSLSGKVGLAARCQLCCSRRQA